jgi:SAM-dependent methyltransferase
MKPPPPDWQMPAGVDRGLWDYLHEPSVARGYDDSLAGSSLFTLDLEFVERFCQPPGRILDLGCGTGRLLLHLVPKGYQPVGVDLSQEMLSVASSKAREVGVDVSLLRASIVELDGLADGCFDHAACLFSTLGMVRGEEARRRVIAHVYRLLRPGGRFVLHAHNRWFNLNNSDGRRWLLVDVWRRLLGRPSGDRLMPPHQGIGRLTLHLFTRGEAVRLLRDSGFRIVEVRPISTRADGRLAWPWLFGGLRAYGWLIGVERPEGTARE